MKKRKQNQNEDFNFWQTSSDVMTGLVIILLLIISLLAFYVLTVNDQIDQGIYPYGGDEQYDGNDKDGTGYQEDDDEGHYDEHHTSDSSGGGGGNDEEYPIIISGGGGDPDEGIKTAIFVKLIDGDTGETIKQKDVTFELYGEKGNMQILNTYYPEKISFRDYKTREDGTFYLPEKIYEGGYYFHQTTDIEGYDRAPDTYFDVEELYDWPEPFVVEIDVSPSKNSVYLHMVDADTDTPVAGGTFDIIAAEDIVTRDGAVRYKKDEIADTVTTDEEGNAVSKELFLGNYIVRETGIPEYYAKMPSDMNVEVGLKTAAAPNIHEIASYKTTATITLVDEMDKAPIEGVTFEISDGTDSFTAKTDSEGKIVLNQLSKATEYKVTQSDTVSDYRNKAKTSFSVDRNGQIETKDQIEYTLTNRMIRLAVTANDKWFSNRIADTELTLYKADGTVVETWTTGSAQKVFTNLEPGEYSVVANGEENTRKTFVLEDSARLQTVNISVTTTLGIIIIIGAALTGVGLIWLLVHMIKRAREKKKERSEVNAE